MPLALPLYKFSSVEGARAILEHQSIRTSSPLDFNDPFEVLPSFDDDRKNLHITSRKEFHRRMGNASWGDLVEGGGEEHMPVESWVGLAALIHDEFLELVHYRFRVLCFSRQATPTLLWSHYSNSHSGIAIGFDLAKRGFPRGRHPEGIEVEYVDDRTGRDLPMEYYTFGALKMMDPPPQGYVKTHGGIIISQADSNALYEAKLLSILSTKQEAWSYEKETRLLYDLAKEPKEGLLDADGFQVACFHPEAVSEIVFGYRCSVADIERLAPLIADRYPQAVLKYVDLHPFKYEVVVHRGDLRQILATHRIRENHTFRSPTRQAIRR